MTDWRQPRSLEAFGKPWPAEQRVLDQLQSGLDIEIGDRVPDRDAPGGFRIPVPDHDAPDTLHLRAGFVRWLALGAEEHPLHEKGLRIRGALIVGHGPEGAETRGLDLEGCELMRDLGLVFCRFTDPLLLRNARLQTLFLNGSHFPGVSAAGLETRGGVFLRGADVDGEVRLVGARLGGDLSCVGATVRNAEGRALSAARLETRGYVFLRGADVAGEVGLVSAWLGGDLDCAGATLRNAKGMALSADGLETRGQVVLRGADVAGEVRLVGAQIGGNLDGVAAKLCNSEGRALAVDGARITGGLFLRGGAVVEGVCVLTAARLGDINDHPGCWPGDGKLVLNRCEYGAFTGTGVDAKTRIRWLAKQDPAQFGKDFWPQPWEQCAKVFREMGHVADARAILIDKERRQRADRRGRMGPIWRGGYWLVDNLVRVTVRYGRQPLWAFAWLAGFWLLGVGIFYDAERNYAIKPNSTFVLRADEWALCAHPQGAEVGNTEEGRAGPGQSQLACFREQPEAQRYPRFNPWIYSLDTLLPVVEMEMQTFWIPDEGANYEWAAVTRHYLWLHIAVGWALSLLAIAGFSGLVKTD